MDTETKRKLDSLEKGRGRQRRLYEKQSSKRTLVKLSQIESYPLEYSALYSGQQVSKSSKLLPLSPFINDERVLCVGSHLKFANVPRTSENQMIVSK